MTTNSLDALADLQREMNVMPARRAELIARARAEGRSWSQIGSAIGMTHAGAIKAAKATANSDQD